MLLFFCEDINRMMGIDREKELELKEIDVIFPWSVFLFLFFFRPNPSKVGDVKVSDMSYCAIYH